MDFVKKKENFIIGGLVILFFAGLLYWYDAGLVRAAQPGIPSMALEEKFVDKEGNSHTLSEFKGKPFILVLWATWCPACVKKMDRLNRFAKTFEKAGGKIVAVSQDSGIDVVKNYYAENQYNNLEIYCDEDRNLIDAAGVRGLPTAIFFNAEGHETHRISGGIDWESPEMSEVIKVYCGI